MDSFVFVQHCLLALKNDLDYQNFFTSDVDEREKLAEEVSVSPEVVMFEIGVHVIDQKLFLQLFLNLGDDAQVQVHPQGRDLAGLPVFPQPTRNVEQNCLQ